MGSYRLTSRNFWRFKLDLNRLIEYYKEKYSAENGRDWKKYEKDYRNRVETAVKELKPIIEEASAVLMDNVKHVGRPYVISLRDKVLMLLLKDIFDTSNRKTAGLLSLFSDLSGVSTSYKTVERLYSDALVSMAIHNMFVIMVRRKNITNVGISGDGTGYGLTVIALFYQR